MTNELLAPLLASTVVAVAGWVATHVLTRRRDRANKRRDQRVQFIIDAYRRLERAANRPGDQAHLYHADVESAVADIQLFGTAGQVGAAREFAAAFARDGAASLHVLLEQLRADLRGELGLGAVRDPLTHLRITYHGGPSASRLAGAAEPRPPGAAPPNVALQATPYTVQGQRGLPIHRTPAPVRAHSGAPELGRSAATHPVRVTETYQPWRPDPDALTPCAGIVLHADPADLTVRLQFSDVRGAPDRDLLVRFGREVVACMSHDEFVHPWQYDGGAGEVPRLPEPWAQYAYPLLLVESSRWLASFSDVQIAEGERAVARHFRFVSLDNTLDVLTLGDAVAEWAPAAARGP